MYCPVNIRYGLLAAIGLLFLSAMESAKAHEMTPTYPKWEVAHVEGIYKATMEMFNKRRDVEWYEVGIFDENWEPIQFVSSYKIIKMSYLSHVKFDVYVSMQDKIKAEYICSISKLRENSDKKPMLATRICSRFK